MENNQSVEEKFGRSKKLNRFIAKTYLIVNSDEPTACWVRGGKSFVILDPKKFSETVLPKYFKHNKLTSFVRQLNFYGFHKVRIDPSVLRTTENTDTEGDSNKETKTRNDIICFQHKFFQANQPKLLQNIQRATKQSGVTVVTESPLPTHQKELEQIQNQLLEMTKRTDSLREEFEMKLTAAKVELEVDYLRRIKALEVCYKDLLVLNLVGRKPMPYTPPGHNKHFVDPDPMVTRSFFPPSQTSSSCNGTGRTALGPNSNIIDHLVDHKVDRLSPLHQENSERKSLFRNIAGNMAPWTDKAFNDISIRLSLNHALVAGKGKMLNSTGEGGIKTKSQTGLRVLPDKLLRKD